MALLLLFSVFVPAEEENALLAGNDKPPAGAAREFSTDFSRHTVPYDDIISGGPPKDGIPAVDDPGYWTVREAERILEESEPVIVVIAGGGGGRSGERTIRIYPIRILMWHEIVNDTIGDLPVAVTYCPLCNTGIVFDRRFDGEVLDFGTTGRLRNSNLIMYDRQTETWWQQATGEGIAGRYAGNSLTMVPSLFLSWKDAKSRFSGATVLSTDTGYSRPYGKNPYTGYDHPDNSPFLYNGPEPPAAFGPVERALVVTVGGETEIFPYPELAEKGIKNEELDGRKIVIFWHGGTASALDDGTIAEGRDVGTANGFLAEINGRPLTFSFDDGTIRDKETGSVWDHTGHCVSGPLRGERLRPIVAVQHFWFSANSFFAH